MKIERLVVAVVLGVLVVAATPRRSEAIPAWARKYGTNCALCHYPNVPRLNSFGHRFRRAGYRTEDEINKAQDIAKIGDFAAMRARVRYTYFKPESGRSDNQFELNDVTFFYGGALASHFSAFNEIEVSGETGDVEVLATISGIWGGWDNFATFRVGQMHTLTRVGFGGLDRPTGISTPLVLSSRFTTPFKGAPFRLNEDQRGLELTYVYGPGRVIAQVLNGVDDTGDGRGSGFDRDGDKDVLVAYEHILDDIASGFTVFGYRGVMHQKFVDGNGRDTTEFFRFGATFAKVFDFGFEVQGGYVRGRDNPPNTLASDVESQGAWVELEHYFKDLNFTPFGRFDWVNPRLGGGDQNLLQGTIGVAAPIEDFLRLAVEGQVIDNKANDHTDYRLVSELMVNF
jgi:hypothetical protein